MLNKIINFATIISTLAIVLKLGLQGELTPLNSVLILILAVFCLATDKKVIKIIIAAQALLYMVKQYTGSDTVAFKQAMGGIGVILIILFGYYIMFGGLRKKNS